MRYLLLSSLLLTLYCCSPSKRSATIDASDKKAVTVFNDTTGAYLYKNKIDLFGHYISGLMMIKPTGKNNYKVAVTTEFGAKILDFEMTDGEFILHDCIPEMRRKMVLGIIEKDMKMLLGAQQQPPKEVNQLKSGTEYFFKNRPFNTIYTVGTDGELASITAQRFKHTLIEIILLDYKDGVPAKIKLEHFRMPVHIEMNILKYPGHVAE